MISSSFFHNLHITLLLYTLLYKFNLFFIFVYKTEIIEKPRKIQNYAHALYKVVGGASEPYTRMPPRGGVGVSHDCSP